MFLCLPEVQMLSTERIHRFSHELSSIAPSTSPHVSRSSPSFFHLIVLPSKGRTDLIHLWRQVVECSDFNPRFWCQSARFSLVYHFLCMWLGKSPNPLCKVRGMIGPTTLGDFWALDELVQVKGSEIFLEKLSCNTCLHCDHCQHVPGGKCNTESRDILFLVHLLKHLVKPALRSPFFSVLCYKTQYSWKNCQLFKTLPYSYGDVSQ